MFLRSWGILKMKFRYFHEIPDFIFLDPQTFFLAYSWLPENSFLLFLGDIYLHILETLFSDHRYWVASGEFCCFSFTYCDYFSIFWRLCPFFMKTSYCTKGDTVAKHADCCSQALLVPASPVVSACGSKHSNSEASDVRILRSRACGWLWICPG